MSDKDFKVKNKLQVKGITSAGPVLSDASGNIDSTPYIATQYGGTGTSTSPNAGQLLYSASGATYAPTNLDSLLSSIPSKITITQVNTSGTATETYTDISTIAFDADSGFDVTNPSTGVAKIAMNSTFKYWQVDGIQKLTATGLDTVNFISGNGITISADEQDTPQSITLAVDTAIIQTRVDGVSDTKIGYLSGVTSSIQSQLDSKVSFPSQTGNAGKYLTTDGTSTSWSSVSGGGTETIHLFAMIG